MEYTQFVQLISNVGFPIAVCIAMFVFMNTTMKKMGEALKNNTDAIKDLREEIKRGGEK